MVATLKSLLAELGAQSGTLHCVTGDELKLIDAVGIPTALRPTIEAIPRGKGMAGQAWARASTVSTCDLPNDPSRVVQPGARAVDATTAFAIPMFDASGRVTGVIGIAFRSAVDDVESLRIRCERAVSASQSTGSADSG
ncbi:MAG: GAF domain-containing protein [Bradymonadia bacterium]